MEIVLHAASSSGEGTYEVRFTRNDGLVTVFCDCPAGIHGKFCKHKWELMNGNSSMLADQNEAHLIEQITQWISASNFKNLYTRVNELENQMEKIKKQIKKEKKDVERRFREGF